MGIFYFLLWGKMPNPLDRGLLTDSQLTGIKVKKMFFIFFSLGSRNTPMLALYLILKSSVLKVVFRYWFKLCP